jgi:serine protease Do
MEFKNSKKWTLMIGSILTLSILSSCMIPSPRVEEKTSSINIKNTQTLVTKAPLVQKSDKVGQGNTVPTTSQGGGQSDLNIDRILSIPDLVEANAPAVVTVAVRKITGGGLLGGQYQEGVGTGFFIDANGIIATNNHVVEGARNVTIILHDSTQVPGEVIWTDQGNDLAIVKVENIRVPGVVTIGDSDSIRVGEGVIAIGNPMSADFAGTVTHGIVSAKNRSVPVGRGYYEYIQIDAAINGGNSGGPLFNMKGEVIGINSAKIAQTGIEGIAFSIPINVLMEKIGTEAETKDQTNEPVSIGVAVQDIPEELRVQYDVPQGIMIMEVVKGSPADKAGLLPGDILTTFGGEEIKSTVQLNTIKSGYKPGSEVEFIIYRDSDRAFYEGTLVLESARR